MSALSFPEERTERQKPDSVTRKDSGAVLGVTRSDQSHFPVPTPYPTPSLALNFFLAATAAPPRRGPQRSPVAAGQAPNQCWGTCVRTLRIWADHQELPVTFLSVVSEPFIPPRGRGLGAPVSPCPSGSPHPLGPMSQGPGPPMSLRAKVSGLQSPHVPRGRCLGAPVPPCPSGPRSQGSGPPLLGEAPGAVSRGPCAQTPAGHVDHIVAPSPVKRPHPGDPGTGWGDDDALKRCRDAQGAASEGCRQPEE